MFYPSKDGTKVPMFVTRHRDLVRDGHAPLLLYGYGGFSNALTPVFSPSVLVWLEMGGVYAVANLRGGSEYGEEWHAAGTRSSKQNVFDDFSSAARWLVDNRYTARDRLAVMGRSNGGLLVGAALTQEPGLYAAALPAVGVLDMLRYQTASANARQWSTDYGLSDDPADFRALRAYSPYHNVHPGTCYPPTLITTADHDDRVVPWHSYKLAQRCRAHRHARTRSWCVWKRAPARRWQTGLDADRGCRRSVGVSQQALRMQLPEPMVARARTRWAVTLTGLGSELVPPQTRQTGHCRVRPLLAALRCSRPRAALFANQRPDRSGDSAHYKTGGMATLATIWRPAAGRTLDDRRAHGGVLRCNRSARTTRRARPARGAGWCPAS
jgi:hypothetical protein